MVSRERIGGATASSEAGSARNHGLASEAHPRELSQARLGQAVKAARRAAGLTQEQVSALSGLHPTYISDIERGVRNPGWDAVTRLAEGIGVSLVEIVRHYEQQ